MVQPKKPHGDMGNGANKRDTSGGGVSRKDSSDTKPGVGSSKADGKIQNGTRAGFRTDTAISNSRPGHERALQPWVSDTSEGVDSSLEKPSGTGHWDQFAENERLFGLKSDYDESIYTTSIDKSHPQYKERMAAADKKAREIERSAPATNHVAEERVMDYVGGDDRGGDEEDKYSGVRRQDFPPLAKGENKYITPAKRAPSALATVSGAPYDPAIISSQLKGAPKKQSPAPAKPEEPNPQTPNSVDPSTTESKANDAKAESKPNSDSAKTDEKLAEAKGTADKPITPLRPSAATSRTISPQAKEGAPSATSTVERDVLNSFKNFATRERSNAEKARNVKAKADKEVKLTELKKFADTFKLSTPVPNDLISIIAKDPLKQKEIQAKAKKNADDIAKAKAETVVKEKDTPVKDAAAKPGAEITAPQPQMDVRGAISRPGATATVHATSPSGGPNRHPGNRQPFASQQYHNQPFQNDRSRPPHMPQQNRQTAGLTQRLRNAEQQKLAQGPNHQHIGGQDVRLPPTGPANSTDGPFARRLSGVPGHVSGKLNPHSHEFRPNASAPPFNPNGQHPSAGSSPRSMANNMVETPPNPSPVGQLIRRKTRAIDVKKCFILAHVETFSPPQGRNWEDNARLRPSYDTPPTWRQLQEDNEKPDSNMHLTYKDYFERQPFAGVAMATPTPSHVVPQQMAHQHQLPFHLQHGAHNLAPRQSPHMPPMQMHGGQHGHAPHVSYSNSDDHRMMHSNSAQSFASPRMAPVPMAYPPTMNSPAQVSYGQPVIQSFVGPGTPQMGQFRSFSNNPQYIPSQAGHMAAPMMIQPQFMTGPQGMVAPQMQMYPAASHAQFIPPGGAPQPMPVSNGYPSPGRPTAPMMVPQGSQQGQSVYGMSPGVSYQQPAFVPQQPAGQMPNVRGYNNSGPQHFGTSPQQMHQYGPQHRSGSASYGKNFNTHGQHQVNQPGHAIPTGPHNRGLEGQDEAK